MTDFESRLSSLQRQAQVFSDCVGKLTTESSFVEVDNMVKSFGKLFTCLKALCLLDVYNPFDSD